MKAFSYDIKIDDSRNKYGSGHSGVVLAEDEETAIKLLKDEYCHNKQFKSVAGIEVKEVKQGIFETWNYSFDKEEVK